MVAQARACAGFCSHVLGFGRLNVTMVTEDMSIWCFTGDLNERVEMRPRVVCVTRRDTIIHVT